MWIAVEAGRGPTNASAGAVEGGGVRKASDGGRERAEGSDGRRAERWTICGHVWRSGDAVVGGGDWDVAGSRPRAAASAAPASFFAFGSGGGGGGG